MFQYILILFDSLLRIEIPGMVKSKITGEYLDENSETPPPTAARGKRGGKSRAGTSRGGGRGRGRGGGDSRQGSPEIPLADIPLIDTDESDVPPLMKILVLWVEEIL